MSWKKKSFAYFLFSKAIFSCFLLALFTIAFNNVAGYHAVIILILFIMFPDFSFFTHFESQSSIAQLNYEINGTSKLSHHWHWSISFVGLAPLIATGNGDYLLGMNNDVGCLAFPDNIPFCTLFKNIICKYVIIFCYLTKIFHKIIKCVILSNKAIFEIYNFEN